MESQVIPIQAEISPVSSDNSTNRARIFVKILLLTLFPILLATVSAMAAVRYFTKYYLPKTEREILISFPMKDVDWKDLGKVFEPLIPLSVKTKDGYKENTFLLDSGAVVSSLPREWAEKTEQDLAFLPRSSFKGFGGTTSFAYQGEMMIILGEEKDVVLPVVFTEAVGTKSLLGRKGFFEKYSIHFNHKERRIEIRR